MTVDVGPDPLPIGGVTYSGRHVTPDGYVPAGVQHLDGDQALWFARSRRNSDDYDRMGRQRCLIGALVAQKSPADVVAHFRQVTAAAAASITTNIPQSLLPALLALADEHRPVLRSVAFDPDLPDPVADRGRFDPADPDVAFMRRVVRAALAPPVVPAPRPAPVVPGTVVDGGPGTVRDGERRTGAGAGLRGVELHGPLLSGSPCDPRTAGRPGRRRGSRSARRRVVLAVLPAVPRLTRAALGAHPAARAEHRALAALARGPAQRRRDAQGHREGGDGLPAETAQAVAAAGQGSRSSGHDLLERPPRCRRQGLSRTASPAAAASAGGRRR